jgi:phosphoribosylamine--glycine ligase
MKVLLVGSGAREHALAWKLRQSKLVDDLLIWPGSATMDALGARLPMGLDAGMADVARLARNMDVDFVVVGPEQPLADGFADACVDLKLPCFGPVAAAAQLESSKAFAKDVMQAAGIPTAAFAVVQGEAACRQKAEEYLARSGGAVIKASGLASGKGVFVCQSQADIEEGLKRLYHSGMAKAAETVVIEEVLVGRECSFFVFLGAGEPTALGFAVDHKRLKDGDEGPNTGGMGCYTPVPWLPADAGETVMQKVVRPLLTELNKRGLHYTGCLYVGLMWGDQGPSVVEFNVRLGDPEAEVLALHDQRDWAQLIAAKVGLIPDNKEFEAAAAQNSGATVCVVLASPCYPYGEGTPQRFEVPREIFQDSSRENQVFAAAVREEQGRLMTGRGRLLTFASHGRDFVEARRHAYAHIKKVAAHWHGVQYRHDIGAGLVEG